MSRKEFEVLLNDLYVPVGCFENKERHRDGLFLGTLDHIVAAAQGRCRFEAEVTPPGRVPPIA
jgi:hypothetical protein